MKKGKIRIDYPRYFRLYKSIKSQLEFIERNRIGGTFGILLNSATDEMAIRYKYLRVRLEIVSSFLENRDTNWGYAYNYIGEEEVYSRSKKSSIGKNMEFIIDLLEESKLQLTNHEQGHILQYQRPSNEIEKILKITNSCTHIK